MRWTNAGRGVIVLAASAVAVGVGVYLLRDVLRPDDTVGGRVARLKSAWPATRREAAADLGRDTSDPETVVPALIAALDDRDADVRGDVLDALGAFGEAARPAASKAAEVLEGDDAAGVRRRAAALLGVVHDPASTPALMEALDDPDPTVRAEAVRSLGRFGTRGKTPPTLPINIDALTDALRAALDADQPDELRSAAVDALDSFSGGDERIAQALADAAVEDPSPAVRKKALSLLRPEYPATVPALVAAVDDPDAQVLLEATAKLAQIGMADDRTVPALCRAALRADDRSREGVGMNLAQLILERGGVSTPADVQTRRYEAAVGDLRRVAEEPAAAGRAAAVTVLCRIAATYEKSQDPALLGPARAALDAVVARIDDQADQPELRLHAMDQWELARTFAQHRDASGRGGRDDDLTWEARWIGAMGRCLASPVPDIRRKAASILQDGLRDGTGSPSLRNAWREVVPKVVAALDGDGLDVRLQLLEVLTALGPEAAPALPELRSLAGREKDAEVHAAVGRAIASIASLDVLKAENPEERSAAAASLATLGWRAESAVPALIDALADPDAGVRVSVADALRNLGPAARTAERPMLDRLAAEPDPATRSTLLDALAAIAPGDPPVVQAHVAALHDPDPGVRATAARYRGLPADDAVIQALARNLADPEDSGRAAADALASQLFRSPAAVTEVIRALQGETAGPLVAALDERFATLSPVAESRAFRDDLDGFREVLTSAIPPLVEASTTVEAGPNRRAVYAILGRILGLSAISKNDADHEAVGPAVEPFLRVLADSPESDAELRTLVVDGLGGVPTRRPEAALTLLKELERAKAPEGRAEVLASLASLATHADDDPALLEAMTPAVPALSTLLESDEADVRLHGVRALGHLGPAALPAEAALKRLAEDDPRPDVRKTAEAAVKAVQGLARMPAAPPRNAGAGAGGGMMISQ
ncbi:HEAT repeat domain-containing protein [Planctomyces sp. SH-PL62]|uniref:HEAT repeat domain-containing protein n=1 Tax=Planctomyces sp. SH-PL62 TaxID=1636152 RepID=UPI00078B416F|nr:HEAT repeat domain-containing protein [Planctomyces sp. SH-PL62]AMV36180.1 HEAT repeat protein [Planctomyces sp. SH-PL62]